MARPVRMTGFNGEMLRQARRLKRLTQSELAQEMGVHRTTLVRWESGLSEPAPDQIQQLCELTSTPKQWFMGDGAEAISFEDPSWLMDPLLKQIPLPMLQKETRSALEKLRKSPQELARLTFLPRNRIDALLQGKPPTPREIQRLRDTFGDSFHPLTGVKGIPVPPSVELTNKESQELLLGRLLRVEQRLQGLEQKIDHLLEILSEPKRSR